jgi:hypothetical protein
MKTKLNEYEQEKQSILARYNHEVSAAMSKRNDAILAVTKREACDRIEAIVFANRSATDVPTPAEHALIDRLYDLNLLVNLEAKA